MRAELADRPQNALEGSVNAFYAICQPDIHHIRTMLILRHDELKSWREAGKHYGISGAMARLIANGYQPGKTICKRLGIRRHPPRPRRAISLTDPASAAETIVRHGGREYALQLAREIERRME